MYAETCDRLGIDPTACLYVGDGGSHELSGATAAGMTAVRLAAADLAGHLAFDVDREWVGHESNRSPTCSTTCSRRAPDRRPGRRSGTCHRIRSGRPTGPPRAGYEGGRTGGALSASGCRSVRPARSGPLPRDLLLKAQDAVQQRLRPGRAAGDIDVDRDELVDALRDRVGVPVRATAVRAGAERDDVLAARASGRRAA